MDETEIDWRILLAIERDKTARLELQIEALRRALGITREDVAKLADPRRLDETRPQEDD